MAGVLVHPVSSLSALYTMSPLLRTLNHVQLHATAGEDEAVQHLILRLLLTHSFVYGAVAPINQSL